MTSKVTKLKNSRVKIEVKANAADLAHAAEHALHHIAEQVTIKGFRQGKAPLPMVVQQAGKGRILSDLVDHALPEILAEVAEKEKLNIIEAPHYTLEKLCELNDDGSLKEETTLEFTAEADVAPEVVVGDYDKIKIKAQDVKPVTDKDVDEVLNQLRERGAHYHKVDRAAKKGDRVEIDFTGKRNGIPEERMTSKHHPVLIGSNTMIQGFEDELIGKKAGDTHTFEITFPKDYHAKDLAGEKVVFDITVHQVDEKHLPEVDAEFAKNFGHDTADELKEAIKQDLEMRHAQEAKEANESATLEEFLKIVKLDVPQSLVEREIDRQVDTMRQQVAMYGMQFDDYLSHLKKTEEQLRDEMRPTAEKAVKIGLGLSVVVEKEDLNKEQNPGYAAIEKLVGIASQTPKPKK